MIRLIAAYLSAPRWLAYALVIVMGTAAFFVAKKVYDDSLRNQGAARAVVPLQEYDSETLRKKAIRDAQIRNLDDADLIERLLD